MTDPPDFFPLIVRGRGGIIADYEGGTLTVQFRKSRVAAGNPTSYNNMAEGSAAWVDRPLHDDEPSVLKQQMNDADAANTIETLRGGGFWKFVCRNTFAGDFEVFRSEPTSAEFNL
jgi:hypothetical protein